MKYKKGDLLVNKNYPETVVMFSELEEDEELFEGQILSCANISEVGKIGDFLVSEFKMYDGALVFPPPKPVEISGKQEDKIYKIKEFINQLERVQQEEFDKLVEEMGFDEEMEEALFEYIYEEEELTFGEYLEEYYGIS